MAGAAFYSRMKSRGPGGRAGCLEDGFPRGEKKLPLPRLDLEGSGIELSHASESKGRQRVPAFSCSFTPSSGELLHLREQNDHGRRVAVP